MTATPEAPAVATLPELVVERHFNAPRDRVFGLWTTAEHLKRWFCPKGYTVASCTAEFEVGGAFDICIRSVDGVDFWWKGTYREIVPGERIVFTQTVTGADDEPHFEAHTVVTFEPHKGRTLLTVRQSYALLDPDAGSLVRAADPGWNEALDRLEALVADMAGPGTA